MFECFILARWLLLQLEMKWKTWFHLLEKRSAAANKNGTAGINMQIRSLFRFFDGCRLDGVMDRIFCDVHLMTQL